MVSADLSKECKMAAVYLIFNVGLLLNIVSPNWIYVYKSTWSGIITWLARRTKPFIWRIEIDEIGVWKIKSHMDRRRRHASCSVFYEERRSQQWWLQMDGPVQQQTCRNWNLQAWKAKKQAFFSPGHRWRLAGHFVCLSTQFGKHNIIHIISISLFQNNVSSSKICIIINLINYAQSIWFCFLIWFYIYTLLCWLSKFLTVT